MLFYTLNLNEIDKTKFEYLYTKYRSLLFCIAYEMLDNEMDAEDAVHLTYLKIIPYLDSIDLEYPFKVKAFITTIIRNHCKNMLKKRASEPVTSWDDLEDWQMPCDIQNISLSLPEENRVIKIIENMPTLYKEVFLLKYVNEMRDSEIADLLGIKTESVRKRIYRGKIFLEKALNEGLNDEN